jgi:hypothetical protein
VEFDSKYHDPPEVAKLDASHDDRLRALGFDVRRYRWPALTRHADATLDEVMRLVAAAAA